MNERFLSPSLADFPVQILCSEDSYCEYVCICVYRRCVCAKCILSEMGLITDFNHETEVGLFIQMFCSTLKYPALTVSCL